MTTPAAAPAFATLDELRYRLTPEDLRVVDAAPARAQVLLEDASDLIRYRCAGWESAPESVRAAVVCRVVARALRQRPAGVAGDASQVTQTTGPFTMSTSWSTPSGDLFLTRQDRDDINGATASFFGCADTLFGGRS